MHLCIPDYEKKKSDGLIVPSGCSCNALSVLLNEESDREYTYHFPVYDIDDQASNVVIIRNLLSAFDLKSQDGDELKSMIQKVCPIVSINQAMSDYHRYGVVRVSLNSPEDAVKVAEVMDGQEFHAMHLRVSHNDSDRPVYHTLTDTSITPAAEEETEDTTSDHSRDEMSVSIRSDPHNVEEERGVSIRWKRDSEREMRIEYMSNGVIRLNGIAVLIDNREIDEGDDVSVRVGVEGRREVEWKIYFERVCDIRMMTDCVEDIQVVSVDEEEVNELWIIIRSTDGYQSSNDEKSPFQHNSRQRRVVVDECVERDEE